MAKTPQQATQQISLSPPALASLGLEQQPFTPSILPPEAVYNHASLTQLKDTVKHHLQFSELLLIIEGNFGSGKTTFFRQLMQEEIPNTFLMPQQVEATDTLVQIQQKMSIHLREQGDANHLDDNLKNMQMFDQTPVLMIDDAHMLSDTTLQELIRYRQQLLNEKECSLKILLFANKGMAATIKHISDLEQSEMFVQDLPALNNKQIVPFIQHRLLSAGASQQPSFDDRTVEAIHKRTTGNPLQIMAQAVVQIEKLAGKKPRSAASLNKPVLLGGGLLVVAAVAAVYLYLFSAPDPDDVSLSIPQPVIPEPPAASTEPPQPAASPDLGDGAMPAPEMTAPSTDPMPAEPQPEIEPTDSSDAADSHILPGLAPTDPEHVSETENEPETAVVTPGSEPPAPPAPPAPKPAAAPPPPPEVKPAPAPTVTHVTRPAPASTTDPAFAELADLGLRNSQWLLQQEPNSWTLQILGAREPDTLVKFARQHQLGSDTAWYVTDLKGKPWYVLVHRSYSQRDVARQAINRLPAALKKARPWAKSMASVQKAIKK